MVIAKKEMFVQALAQYVQAKSNKSDELGVYKMVDICLKNPLLEVSANRFEIVVQLRLRISCFRRADSTFREF